MKGLSWEMALKRDDIIGGDFKLIIPSNKGVVRGPIISIKRVGSRIAITMQWATYRAFPAGSAWVQYGVKQFSFPEEQIPLFLMDNKKQITCLMKEGVGTFTIYLQGQEKLDPGEVFGLTPEELA